MSASPALLSIAFAVSLAIPAVSHAQASTSTASPAARTSLRNSNSVVSPSGGISIGRNTTRAKLAQNAQNNAGGGQVNGTPGAPNNTIPGGAPGIPPNTQDSPNNPPQIPPYNAPGATSNVSPPYNNPQGVPSNPPGTPPGNNTGSPPTNTPSPIPPGTPGAIPSPTPGSPSFNTPGSAGSAITPGAPAGSAGAAGVR